MVCRFEDGDNNDDDDNTDSDANDDAHLSGMVECMEHKGKGVCTFISFHLRT